jgi:hypothetical protein
VIKLSSANYSWPFLPNVKKETGKNKTIELQRGFHDKISQLKIEYPVSGGVKGVIKLI